LSFPGCWCWAQMCMRDVRGLPFWT